VDKFEYLSQSGGKFIKTTVEIAIAMVNNLQHFGVFAMLLGVHLSKDLSVVPTQEALPRSIFPAMGHEDASCDARKVFARFPIENDFSLFPSDDEGVLDKVVNLVGRRAVAEKKPPQAARVPLQHLYELFVVNPPHGMSTRLQAFLSSSHFTF
jgi:hypothetical protein